MGWFNKKEMAEIERLESEVRRLGACIKDKDSEIERQKNEVERLEEQVGEGLAEVKRLEALIKDKDAKIEREKNDVERLKILTTPPPALYAVRDGDRSLGNYGSNISSIYKMKVEKSGKPGPSFFTQHEYRLFDMLTSIVNDQDFKVRMENQIYFVFPKCRLIDIIELWGENWGVFRGKDKATCVAQEVEKACHPVVVDDDIYKRIFLYDGVSSMHIDFLICKQSESNKGKIIPALAIELDDPSKTLDDRQKRNYDLKTLILENISQDRATRKTCYYKIEFNRLDNSDLKKEGFDNQLKDMLIKKLKAAEDSYNDAVKSGKIIP